MNDTSQEMKRWWDLPAAALLMAALLTAAARLIATKWTTDLDITQVLVAFGVIAGWALGKSRFSPRMAVFFATAYGLFAIPWRLGSAIREDILWTERLSILWNRLTVIIYQLVNQEPVQDSLLFLIAMSALFWVLGTHAGYTLVRYGNPWKATLPAGLSMFIIHSFDPYLTRRTLYLAAYLFFALMLIARMNFLYRQSWWQKNRTALPPHLGFDFIRFAFFAALLIVIFAWTAPALANAVPAAQEAWRPVQRAWNSAKDDFDNAFASLRSSVNVVTEYYGPSAVLGRGNPLSDSHVFSVKPPRNIPPGVRLYWRARTYDTYEDGHWQSSITQVHNFNPQEDELSFADLQGRWPGSFDFINHGNIVTLFTPPQPLWVNRPGQVEYATNPDGTIDIASFRATPSLQSGQVYKAQASLSYATVAQLRAAGTEYPEWITERYLQLPESITPRTYELAERITAGLDTPYEKVAAITDYLRKNITYIDQLPEAPPNNQEVIDWFLFDFQQGFCNYYSTAEIVLLRALGIPARWAVGYAQGEAVGDLREELTYIVRQKNAHAWPEVYFPGLGWVEFEPTASEPIISRLPGENIPESLDPEAPAESESQRLEREFLEEMELMRQERESSIPVDLQQNRSYMVYWAIALVIGVGLLFLGWRYRSKINITFQAAPIMLETSLIRVGIRPPKALQVWARRASLPPLSKAYLEVNQALARLGEPPELNATPSERADSLGQILPVADKPAHQLVDEYQVATFSQQPANMVVALKASNDVRRLSYREFIHRLLARLQRRPRKS